MFETRNIVGTYYIGDLCYQVITNGENGADFSWRSTSTIWLTLLTSTSERNSKEYIGRLVLHTAGSSRGI